VRNMNLSSLQLYAQMEGELCQLEMYCGNETGRLEICFNITRLYWNNIKDSLGSFTFKYEADEIHFFRHVKPLFMSAIEYYTMRYQASLFKPDDSKGIIAYWLHELRRAELFYTRHKKFLDYYFSEQTQLDNTYFTRCNHIVDPTGKACSNKLPFSAGHIAAQALAFRKYCLYIENELKILMPKDTRVVLPVRA
jgi:hypothetical protein